MDCYPEEIDDVHITEYTGLELERRAGFGKDGYKNFNGIITELQMQTYLTIRDFRRKKNKKGKEYGMQEGDGTPTITREEQIEETVEAILKN